MDLLKLHYFYQAAKYENISKAAELLLISQPALSKAISNLERELEMDLFFRNGKRISLNENGRFLFQHAVNIFCEVDKLDKLLAERRGEGSGKLSIVTTLPYTITNIITNFMENYRDIKYEQLPLSEENIRDFLEKGKYDVCISTEKVIHKNVTWIPLMEEVIYLSLPKSMVSANTTEIDLTSLNNIPFIGFTPKYSFRRISDHFCENIGFFPSYQVEVEEATAILQLVKSGKGAAFTPQTAITEEDKNVVHLKITNGSFTRTIGLLKHNYAYQTQITDAFIEHCINYFKHY